MWGVVIITPPGSPGVGQRLTLLIFVLCFVGSAGVTGVQRSVALGFALGTEDRARSLAPGGLFLFVCLVGVLFLFIFLLFCFFGFWFFFSP